jgi:soluble lytic murein transglycosylase
VATTRAAVPARAWDGPVCEDPRAWAPHGDPAGFGTAGAALCAPRGRLDDGRAALSGAVATRSTAAHAVTPFVGSAGGGPPGGVGGVAPLTEADARRALAAARAAIASNDPLAARAHLRVVARWAPEIGDRVAWLDGEAALAGGLPEQACASFAVAARSPSPDVVVRAEVGGVRCLLAAGDRRGERALAELLSRYRALPVVPQLRLELAEARAAWGDRAGAAALLRAIDLEAPGGAQAERARRLLDALRAEGVVVPELSEEERVARAERLLRTGPMDAARAEVAALREGPALPAALGARVLRMASRIARAEGRFEEAAALAARADPDRDRRQAGDAPIGGQAIGGAGAGGAAVAEDAGGVETAANGRGAPTEPAIVGLPSSADALSGVGEQARRQAQQRLATLLRARGVERMTVGQLVEVARLGVRAGARAEAEAALRRLDARGDVPAAVRLELGLTAVGAVDDALIAALLAPAVGDAGVGVTARYHRARALERLGRDAEAVAELERVRATDRSELRWYALWATQRLRALGALASRDDARAPPPLLAPAAPPQDGGAKAGEPSPARVPRPGEALQPGGRGGAVGADESGPEGGAPSTGGADLERAAALLAPLARAHGDAFPWIRRALALTRLGDPEAAGDELFMAWVASREARGLYVPTAGLDAVCRGGVARRTAPDPATRRARAALPESAFAALADAAAALDDAGLAIRFGGRARAGSRPRPHAAQVEAAAERHGLDPDLLWAVMRVESVYDRRVVSHAGAIGLLQIMPRTGALIAHAKGEDGFITADLLDPATNIDFAAWYLASLLRRFDGRLPLAIAAYNGGPHNVRRWMAERPADMPLDAFLEHIPFAQTHRYVRRVLGHYAAYRADRGADMVRLDLTLPGASIDTLAF